jgi:hypothetical protein
MFFWNISKYPQWSKFGPLKFRTLHWLTTFGSNSSLLRCHLPENRSLMESQFFLFCWQMWAEQWLALLHCIVADNCHDIPSQFMHFILILLVSQFCISQFNIFTCWCTQDSIVSRVTCYRLDGSGERIYVGVRVFMRPSRPALRPIHPPIKWVLGLFSRDKAARTWYCPPTPIQCWG